MKISSAVHDKGNTFVRNSAPILNCEDAHIILDAICTHQALNPALHVHFAYHFPKVVSVGAQKYVEFYEDDHEWGAGRRLLHALQETKTDGYMVAVTRWMGLGNILLGTKPFKHSISHVYEVLKPTT